MKNKVPIFIFIVLTILYILLGYGVTITNDSVTNIDQITSLDLWSRSSHFSFHLFGIIFYSIFSKLVGLSAVSSIQIMLAIFSAAAAAVLYLITLIKYHNVDHAIITVIIYSIASGILRFSCQVEYIVLVPSLGIISLYFYSKNQFLFAGLVFGLGLLTSVLIVLIIPIFLLFTSFKEIINKKNIIFAVSAITIFFAINLFTYRETFSGTWSYGGEVDIYKEILGEINYLRPIAILVYGYLRSFNFIIILMPIVLYYLYKSNKELFYLLVATIIIHLPLAIPEARYGGYQMTAYPILAISAGYFLNNVLLKRKYFVYIIIFFFVTINFFVVITERSFFKDLETTYVQLDNNLKNNSVLIVYQASKPITNVYAPNLQVYPIKSEYQRKIAEHDPRFVPTDLSSIIKNNETFYILESGQSMPDDYLKLFFNKFTKNQGAKVKGFALERVLKTDPNLSSQILDGYPLDVYKLTKVKD